MCYYVQSFHYLKVDVRPGGQQLEGNVGVALFAGHGQAGQSVLSTKLEVNTWRSMLGNQCL